jgi:serine/threonine protein kinase/Tol biopolymer transport system component
VTGPAGGRPEINDHQWQRLEQLLEPALDLTPDARQRFLDAECGGDEVLRGELESLLAAHTQTGPLDLDLPARSSLPGPATGTVVSHYEILDQLGSGGMGVVVRARDLRLGRMVALKFLPPRLSGDLRAKRRFLSEARAAAALEHPNVCTVHEIGETSEGQLFIAMALVKGESLRELIARGPVPVSRAVDIARQIARGLACAHASDIVHRDVKPANVMVGSDGIVRLVDFGVAKLAGATAGSAGATPGTAAYMSPEQARGEEVDPRTDVWALGVVLYEMLVGQRPFGGGSEAALLHQIVASEPAGLRTVRDDVPIELERVVARALAKGREDRFGSAAEFDEALRPRTDEAPNRVRRSQGVRAAAAAAVLIAFAALGAYWLRWAPDESSSEMLRVSISAPGTVTPQLSAAISPDGRQLAFVATDSSGESLLWVRAFDQPDARALAGTQRAAHPFWSPDGRSLGFIADDQVKRIDLEAGRVTTLAGNVIRYGPAWGPDGTILFSGRFGELAAVAATGGGVRTVLSADSARGQTSLVWPRFLPDGRHFVYFAASEKSEHRGIYIGSLDSPETTFLLPSDFRAWYAPPGYLVFPRDDTLMAQGFDAATRRLRGEPQAIARGVWFARPAGQASFSLSENGTLAYVNAQLWDGELAWFDRAGRPQGAVGPPVRYEGLTPEISPDGRRVAVGRGEIGHESVWILGVNGGPARRLTSDPEDAAGQLVWSSDGRSVMYRTGARIVVREVDGTTEWVVLDSLPGHLWDWSRDGRFIVFQSVDSRVDLLALRLDGERRPMRLTETPWNEAQAQLSPDGRWLAYTSNESGRDEVYVQSFPESRGRRQVSTGGGAMPRWRDDGRELVYLAGTQFLTAIPVMSAESFGMGAPVPLFKTRLVVEGSESTVLPTRFDVAPGGERFLLRYPPVDPGPPITVVINWTRALTR